MNNVRTDVQIERLISGLEKESQKWKLWLSLAGVVCITVIVLVSYFQWRQDNALVWLKANGYIDQAAITNYSLADRNDEYLGIIRVSALLGVGFLWREWRHRYRNRDCNRLMIEALKHYRTCALPRELG